MLMVFDEVFEFLRVEIFMVKNREFEENFKGKLIKLIKGKLIKRWKIL